MVEITSSQDFAKLRYRVESSNLKLNDFLLEDGYLYLQFGGDEYKISGNWDEPLRTYIRNWLCSQSDELFALLKQESFIFGKCPIERIVSCEVHDDHVELFIENEDGVEVEVIPYQPWILSNKPIGTGWDRLEGNLHYKFLKYYDNMEEWSEARKAFYRFDTFTIWDQKEAAMVMEGFTYFKGMKVEDVSVLSFDIEASGLTHDESSKVFCISNTYRKNGKIVKKLFSEDEYDTEAEMFDEWCLWVLEMNPSIILGHNIFGYDLPYMDHCARKAGTHLRLGRDASAIRFDEKPGKFRRDGSQAYDFYRAHIYGRELVDTMFLAYHYDQATRKYESYSLKPIIKHEGLEKKDRVFYDASQIAKNWHIPKERKKIKKYAIDDSDDALALYDLMIPSYFYFNQSIPKTFQVLNQTATGSQLNAFMLRSYLQDGHSIPKTTEANEFVGAISMGNPGVYKNCFKVDVASLYPSIMLQYGVYDNAKDPYKHFFHMVNYFTNERLKNKKLGKETSDRYYKDLEQSQKIGINSAYGLLGTPGLAFNSPRNAAFVTTKGREILKFAIEWATGLPFVEKTSEEDEDEE